ncbi:MAG: sulfite exporter TauE/SafE family protein [Micavibrio sp.]
MQIYLPIAEMAVPAELILLLGTFVGFLSGVFGVGGGFLMTPFLIFMGLPPAIAVGTQANQLVAASLSGLLGHTKRGNVDFKMGGIMLAGSLIGSVLGVLVFRLLQHLGQIDFVIPMLYVLLLSVMGIMMLTESISSILLKKDQEAVPSSLQHHPFFQNLPYKMRFPRSRLYMSALVPGGIGFVGGVLVSILGIGGGFLLVPAMIYILGMPTLLVVGTSLFQIMITTIVATMMHAVANHSVDLVLAFMLIIGGVVGAQLGVRAGKRIKGVYARIILAAMLLLVSFELAVELLMRPDELYSTVVR